MWMVVALIGLSVAQDFSSEIKADEGVIAISGGYSYSLNPFFMASEEANDPVTSTYYGSPLVSLRFGYYPLATVPVLIDVDWTHEHHELASAGWIDLHAVGVSLSAGYQPQVNWYLQPYGLLGLDQSLVFVSDKIRSVETPASTLSSSMGAHGALGVMIPTLFSGLPWFGATSELRYTWSPMSQRHRPYWLKGLSATVGLQARFDVSNFGQGSHFVPGHSP